MYIYIFLVCTSIDKFILCIVEMYGLEFQPLTFKKMINYEADFKYLLAL